MITGREVEVKAILLSGVEDVAFLINLIKIILKTILLPLLRLLTPRPNSVLISHSPSRISLTLGSEVRYNLN